MARLKSEPGAGENSLPADDVLVCEVLPVDDHARGEDRTPSLPDGEPKEGSVATYETVDGVVLYDADNPLAWLQSTAAVELAERR